MGYTSERTTINKSLESLNQETQRLQKQTNYEFDRLNDRRRDNQAANLSWLSQNQQKLDMGSAQFQELQDSYEPESGYNDATKEMMGKMRDEYYNLLQNKVPKLDENGDPIEGEYEEDIKRASEQKNKLMKGVKTTSQMQGAFAAVNDQVQASLSIEEGKPGALDPRTDQETTGLFKPFVKQVPEWDSKAGKPMNKTYNAKLNADGTPEKDSEGNIVYEDEPAQTRDGGEFVRGVESGEIGIMTYGDGAPARDQMQSERYEVYAPDFSAFKDMTNLNDVNTYKDFNEVFTNFKNDIAQMDVSGIISDNSGMSKNWTNIVDRMATNASESYGDEPNPFAQMLMDSGVTDENGDGLISKDEFTGAEANALMGAWQPGNEAQKGLAEKFYHTYDPSSGILPSYVNDMIKKSQTIGGDQLTANQRRLQQQNANTAKTPEEKIETKRTDAFKANPNAVDGNDNAALSAQKPADPTKEGPPFKVVTKTGNVVTVKWDPTANGGKGDFIPA